MKLQPQLVASVTGADGGLVLRRADRTLWRQIAHLFPEFSLATGPATSSGRRLRFVPGLLCGPAFTPAAAWVSGVVSDASGCSARTGFAGGDVRDADWARRARNLASQIASAEVGGRFWAPKLPDGPDRIIVRPATSTVLDGFLQNLLGAHAAGEVLLLADGLAPPAVAQAARLGVAIQAGPVDPWSVLRRARVLHVGGNDELACLGILSGKPVVCHAPGAAIRGNGSARDMDELADALLLSGTRYGDPRTGARVTCEGAIALLSEWRSIVEQNRTVGCCVGVAFWKRTRIAAFFHNGCQPPQFRRRAAAAAAAAAGRAVAGWNSRLPAGLEPALAASGARLLRVEDGFIRSRGLGSGFLPPASIIVDSRGIYYDPRQPSDLEHILAATEFDAALRARASALIERLNQRGITKYGGGGAAVRLGAPPGVRRILVPGQVADDLSVALGGGAVASNLALLEQVRSANPGAWLIYKPHPDVEAGHRPGVVAEADLRRCADEVARDAVMSALIGAVDEVHTMTSLAGFEALLRGRAVTVYGQPFYAGWGLTEDLAPPDLAALARRTRRLRLEELAAGVLILYPRYLDPQSGLPCGPELLIDRLDQPELWRPSWLMRLRHLQGILNRRLQKP